MYDENCTSIYTVQLEPTQLRLDKTYIIAYVNWTWTITTGIIPFVALLLLNVRIFSGLKKVQKNLGRHQERNQIWHPQKQILKLFFLCSIELCSCQLNEEICAEGELDA